jgi:hypothetical protein
MSGKEYVLNWGQCQNRSPSRPGIRSVSGCRPCLSFPCGPKTLRNLQEVAAVLDVASGPGHLTSESAPVPILEKGADVNAHGGEHGSALQAALSKHRDDIVQLLLKHGADSVSADAGAGSA